MRIAILIGLIATCATTSIAQVTIPGADGSDGAFNPTSNVTIDLALADVGTWNGPNPNPGEGVYDPQKWAVVFRYSSVNIPAGVQVSFRNRNYLIDGPNPPVIWLVSGTVTIGGVVWLRNSDTDPVNMNRGVPGAFRGAGSNDMGGLGPGGTAQGQPARYASPGGYGNPRCIPLIGGSGGGAGSGLGGGGGGAILIAASGTVSINGVVDSVNTAGSFNGIRSTGGTIRLVCNRLQGSGFLFAYNAPGGNGDDGRIRVEANEVAFGHIGQPVASFGLPGTTAVLWPEDLTPTPPRARVVSLGSETITRTDASFAFPDADVSVTTGAQVLVIECQNIPTGIDPPFTTAWNVVARVVPRGSSPIIVNATYVSGDFGQSIWHASLNLPTGFSAIQVRASMP